MHLQAYRRNGIDVDLQNVLQPIVIMKKIRSCQIVLISRQACKSMWAARSITGIRICAQKCNVVYLPIAAPSLPVRTFRGNFGNKVCACAWREAHV